MAEQRFMETLSPFYEAHPRLSWRDVSVVVRSATGKIEDEHHIDWRQMSGDQRLELESLLVHVCR